MPGLIPERNPDLDVLIKYDPSNSILGPSLMQVSDTDIDDENEEFVEVVLNATSAVKNAALAQETLKQLQLVEEEQRKVLGSLE